MKYCIFFLVLFVRVEILAQKPLKLWYNKPANSLIKDDIYSWKSDSEGLKALPVGNGYLGAMVYGDVNNERIQLKMGLKKTRRQLYSTIKNCNRGILSVIC